MKEGWAGTANQNARCEFSCRSICLLTSVHRMTFPFALYSEPWKIFTLVIDSIDLPSIGLTTLEKGEKMVSSIC